MPPTAAPSPLPELEGLVGPSRVHRHSLRRRLFAKDAGMQAGGGPVAVVFPERTDEVVAAVVAARHAGLAVVTRGIGTGLAGGAVPDGGLVVATTRMTRVLEVDPEAGTAWVEPGGLNLDLSRHTGRWGLHFAPDLSLNAACTIGGNVATNAGGPHGLAEGATADHVLALELATGSGEPLVLGSASPDPPGLDLRAAVVGSEGTLGPITRVLVRLIPDPPAVGTLLMGFASVEEAAAAVSAVGHPDPGDRPHPGRLGQPRLRDAARRPPAPHHPHRPPGRALRRGAGGGGAMNDCRQFAGRRHSVATARRGVEVPGKEEGQP